MKIIRFMFNFLFLQVENPSKTEPAIMEAKLRMHQLQEQQAELTAELNQMMPSIEANSLELALALAKLVGGRE